MRRACITSVGAGGAPTPERVVERPLTRAGRATPPGRSIKRTLQLRYATLAGSGTRGSVVAEPVQRWRRPLFTRKTSLSALVGATGVRATARGERTGRVNWGHSAAGGPVPHLDRINHKPLG